MALGKGLSALIPDSVSKVRDSEAGDKNVQSGASVSSLDIRLIRDNPFQPRQHYDEAKLDELASSLKEKGFIQPIVVRRVGDGYEVVAGERRLKAARKLGLEAVPALIREVSDQEAVVLALVENVQREELNPVEKAETYRRLINEFQYSQEEVAKSVGKDRVTVANLLRLLKLPEQIRAGLADGAISEGHARALLSVEDDNARMMLFLEVVRKGLSVREVEQRAKAGGAASRQGSRAGRARRKDPELLRLEEELRGLLGTKVSVENSRNNKGRLVIEYYSLSDLDRVLEVIRK